ncbi:20552_t:CDS:2, partial [Dentiscutata erythropus]
MLDECFHKILFAYGIHSTQRAEESHGCLEKAIEAASGLDQHDLVPILPLSLLSEIAINKALYILEEKYKSLNDCGSKATFLNKINTLIDKKIITPKASLHIENRGQPTSTKRDLYLVDGPCIFKHWMRMPQMGDVIANVYQRPLYFFLLQINFTFLPYYQLLNQNEALAIAIVNNNYYVAIILKP